MADSSQVPGYGNERVVSGQRETGSAYSGRRTKGGDTSAQPGQYPPGGWGNALFGGALPTGTGAPGTAGNGGTDDDPTVEAGQTVDGLTGLADSDIVSTGAPGTAGSSPSLGTGPDAVTFTRPGSPYSGSYASDTVRDETSGPQDWTGANDDGYATGGPQLPGIKGNEPQAGGGRFQPGGGGRVLRGGRPGRG